MLCPTCKKAVDNNAPPKTYPFCSERCKLIDLGRWLDGKYQIPVEEPEEMERGTENAERETEEGND